MNAHARLTRRQSLLFLACATATVVTPHRAFAATVKDATLGTYVRFGDANIRIDRIERVPHADGNPIIKDSPVQNDVGYLIYSISVQNPGSQEIFMPSFGFVEFLDDQSKVDTDTMGPYVGKAKADAPGRLAPKESIRVRVVHDGIPPDRTVTKIMLPARDGATTLRFQLRPADITTIAETPKPQE